MTDEEKEAVIERAALRIADHYSALDIGLAHARGISEHAFEAVGFFETMEALHRIENGLQRGIDRDNALVLEDYALQAIALAMTVRTAALATEQGKSHE